MEPLGDTDVPAVPVNLVIAAVSRFAPDGRIVHRISYILSPLLRQSLPQGVVEERPSEAIRGASTRG